jgi:glycosyltransferase involved in cell wall biosynthesis
MASRAPVRVLLVSSHPVQYAVPVYRRYATDPRLDVHVAFCSMQGAERGTDPHFRSELAWDVPLLDGYAWTHVPNRSPRPRLEGTLGLVNPGLWGLVRRGRFDVVVCYGYRSASVWIAALAAKTSGPALVLTTDAHTLTPRDRRGWKVVAKRALLPRLFRMADAAFVPSSRSARFLERLGLQPERVVVTPFVVDTSFFAEAARRVDRDGVRRHWGITPDAPVALFAGKLVPWKRPQDLLDAASRVEGLHVVFAGEGPLRPTLDARARGLGIAERVRFLGFVNQRGLPDVYLASDLLVLPSEYEAFGVVVNEAFACGRPAVVSEACGAAEDLVRDGESGYVVPVGDHRALAGRLATLASDPELRREMGRKARARIDEWGPEENAAAFAEACLALAGRRNP